MKIFLNSSEYDCQSAVLSIAQLIISLDLSEIRLAIVLNGTVVTRIAYEETQLQEGDHVDIIIAVGGG